MQLETERLILRPIGESDAAALFPLINDAEIVRYTLNIPHPYPEDGLVPWIRMARESMERNETFHFAVVPKATGKPVGDCSLIDISWDHMNGEFAYWLGRAYWGHGYMTEAVREIVRFGFEDLDLERIHARVFSSNIRSIRVIEKAGLKLEYTARHEARKNGESIDMLHYGLIREEYAG